MIAELTGIIASDQFDGKVIHHMFVSQDIWDALIETFVTTGRYWDTYSAVLKFSDVPVFLDSNLKLGTVVKFLKEEQTIPIWSEYKPIKVGS